MITKKIDYRYYATEENVILADTNFLYIVITIKMV